MLRSLRLIISLIFLIGLVSCEIKKDTNQKSKDLKNVNLPPCKLCKVFVESFNKGMDKTAKSNFQGGDTAWEEENLGDYANSEIRFVEIQEKLCDDVEEGNSQCHRFYEEIEYKLEEWWFKGKKDNPDLFDWLCIKVKKQCCPYDHYGPLCSSCPGYPNNVCNGNGKCRGSGTRKGNGTCNCNEGYSGANCDVCAETYYESYRDENKLLCSKCHAACLGSCTRAGPKGCLVCNKGWFYESERGCMDINECVSDVNPCKNDEFCVNNDGSYSCLDCDKSCNGCHGDGPDMCDKCADDHLLKDGICIKDTSDWSLKSDNVRRYITYLGLCVATSIVFQKNPLVASLIGLLVALYVAVSEYMLGYGSVNAMPVFKF